MPRFILGRRRASRVTIADKARDARQWKLAARYYRRALAHNPSNPPIWVQYGHALKESGNLQEAENAYRRAIVGDPAAPDSYLQLGHVLKIQGKNEEAGSAYLRAFTLDPSLDDASLELTGLGWAQDHLAEVRRLVGSDRADSPILEPEPSVLHSSSSGDSDWKVEFLHKSAIAPALSDSSGSAHTSIGPSLVRRPDLSVIMPTYNRGSIMESSIIQYLRCAKNANAELIVIDDGSKDDTPERLSRLTRTHPNLVVDRVENSGPARARNLAASMSRGEILVFVGDDVKPVDEHFLTYHLAAHGRFRHENEAILGKIAWPDAGALPVNFVMSHIQGDGGQQFSYKTMEPYSWYDWKYFYSSNVSVKRRLVADWINGGYDPSFFYAALEDPEFALRMTKRYQAEGKDFRIYYVPAAALEHFHPYTVESFLQRQVSVGMMANRFLEIHPERAPDLGLAELIERLNDNSDTSTFPIEHYLSMFDGLKSWAIVIEKHYGLGSQNWHATLLKSIFLLAYFEGYIRSKTDSSLNYASACRYVLESVRSNLNAAIFTELLGSHSGPGLV